MEDRSPLCESIEVMTRFVKQYHHLRDSDIGEDSRDSMVLVTSRPASQHPARVEGVAQAVTDVVHGNHSEKNH
jgi:hypothetical protein